MIDVLWMGGRVLPSRFPSSHSTCSPRCLSLLKRIAQGRACGLYADQTLPASRQRLGGEGTEGYPGREKVWKERKRQLSRADESSCVLPSFPSLPPPTEMSLCRVLHGIHLVFPRDEHGGGTQGSLKGEGERVGLQVHHG